MSQDSAGSSPVSGTRPRHFRRFQRSDNFSLDLIQSFIPHDSGAAFVVDSTTEDHHKETLKDACPTLRNLAGWPL